MSYDSDLWTIEHANDPEWIMSDEDRALVRLAHAIDPVNGPAAVCLISAALSTAQKEGSIANAEAYTWLRSVMRQRLIPGPTLIDKMSYASAALKAIAAYSLQRASPEDRQQAERSAEVMSMRTGLGTAIGILLAAVTVIERTSAQLFADATNGGGG